jgi:hypothetical protein
VIRKNAQTYTTFFRIDNGLTVGSIHDPTLINDALNNIPLFEVIHQTGGKDLWPTIYPTITLRIRPTKAAGSHRPPQVLLEEMTTLER